MDIAQRKEQFSIAYIHTIAAQIGLNTASLSVDNDSVDLILKGKGYAGKIRNPQIELQLKCTSQTSNISQTAIHYPLKLKNYNDLRGNDVLCPRYLVVLLVPENPDDWIYFAETSLTLRNACYWASIRHYPKTFNKISVSVDIPLSQQLTNHSLSYLMECASKGVYL